MGLSFTGNKTHDDAVRAADATRVVAIAAASTQAAVNSAEIAFARTGLASAIKQNCGTECWTTLLKSLGVQT